MTSNKKSATSAKQQRSKQHRVQLICAVMLVILGCGLLIAGFTVPPIGEVHPSILIAFGEILTFVGALFGIDYHYKARTHIKSTKQ